MGIRVTTYGNGLARSKPIAPLILKVVEIRVNYAEFTGK